MNTKTDILDDGFRIVAIPGGSRTQFMKWSAKGPGDVMDSGMIDLSMVDIGHSINITTGWKPEFIEIDPVRDKTPGVHQPFHSTVPPGACEISFMSKLKSDTKVDFYISPSGHSADARMVKSISKFESDTKVSFLVPSKESWTKIFVKKAVESSDMIAISDVIVLHAVSGIRFECLSHLIKPEYKGCEKSGRSALIFRPEAARYAYFSLSLQKS